MAVTLTAMHHCSILADLKLMAADCRHLAVSEWSLSISSIQPLFEHPHLCHVQRQAIFRLHTTSWGGVVAKSGSLAMAELALLGRGLHGLLLGTGRAFSQVLYCCHSALGLHRISLIMGMTDDRIMCWDGCT